MSQTIYLFLAEGFEETEAICPLDILRRAKLNAVTVATGGKLSVCSTRGISIKADMLLEEVHALPCPQAVVLPGGMPGAENLDIPKVHEIVSACYENGGIAAAICAAPKILGGMGLLAGKRAVCYPGFEKMLKGAKIENAPVVLDGRILTAVGMGAALDFGLKLVEILTSADQAQQIARSVFAPHA